MKGGRTIHIKIGKTSHQFPMIKRNPSTGKYDFIILLDQVVTVDKWIQSKRSFDWWIEPSKKPKLLKGCIRDRYPVRFEESEDILYYIGMLEEVNR